MFPLRDDNPTRLFPLFTVALTVACAAVWVLVQGAGLSPEALDASVCALGAIPAEVSGRAGTWADGPCPPGGLSRASVVSMDPHLCNALQWRLDPSLPGNSQPGYD